MPRAGDVAIQDLQAWMAESYARRPNYAPRLRSYIVTAWKWAVKNRYDYRGGARDYGITYNIAEQLPTTPKNKPGDRFLSNDELKALWHALDRNHPTHRVLKLMIAMGGLRVTEVTISLAANWRDGWLLLPETKNGRSHQLPITRTAAPLVARCLELTHPRSPYLMYNPRDPDEPLTMAAISRGAKRLNKQLKFPDWNPREIVSPPFVFQDRLGPLFNRRGSSREVRPECTSSERRCRIAHFDIFATWWLRAN
jgi:integrase